MKSYRVLILSRTWLASLVPMWGWRRFAAAGDELADLDHEVADEGESAAVDGLAFDGPEPQPTTLSQDAEVGDADLIREWIG
jgi:hypothetical protein